MRKGSESPFSGFSFMLIKQTCTFPWTTSIELQGKMSIIYITNLNNLFSSDDCILQAYMVN